MLAPITHILPLTNISRERVLPVPGRVVVRKGQKVNASDTIAEAILNPEHILLEVGRGLGLPADKADAFLQRKTGDVVAAGDVIAGPVGLARRVVRAPQGGKIVVAGSGQVLLELETQPFELRAGYTGIVNELIPDRGAIIETTGALIQGVWGNGRVDFGLMSVEMRTPDDVLAADRLDVSLRGSVVLGGYCGDEAVLTTASDLPLRGLILGSMSSALVPLALRMRYPIIVLEGFGRISMNSVAFKLLSTNARRDTALLAEPWNRLEGTRPEIIIPLPASGAMAFPTENDSFKPGQQVLVVRAPFKSRIGSLVSIRPGLTPLANGLRVAAAEIRLENGESAVLPLANLVVLE